MDQKNIPTSLAPEILLGEIGGDLQVKGWERAEVQIRADPDALTVEEKDDVVRLSCHSDCSIRLPTSATIQLESVHGDARFKLLEDTLTIQRAHGELLLRSVGEVSVGQVNGNLIARQIGGDLKSERINGNAFIRSVQGDCVLARVGGNLELQDAHGEMRASTGGNIRLRLGEFPQGTHRLEAQGNITCELPEQANVILKIKSMGESIHVRLPGNNQSYHQQDLELTLGNGEATLELEAKGSVTLTSLDGQPVHDEDESEADTFTGLPSDFAERIARQVEAQIEAQMEAMTRQMNEQFSRMSEAFTQEGMNEEEAERIMQEARSRGERAAEQAQERLRRAREKMEHKLELHRRRMEAQAQAAERRAHAASRRGWHFEWSTPKPPTPPPAPAATEEERLMILKMLEQKKISLEEATKLLEALEGKS